MGKDWFVSFLLMLLLVTLGACHLAGGILGLLGFDYAACMVWICVPPAAAIVGLVALLVGLRGKTP
jgi:xanthosine utilization system XapX-like protein